MSLFNHFLSLFNFRKEKIDLEDNLQFIKILINAIPIPIFYKNKEGIYKYCNKAFFQYMGLKREDIINHTVYDINPEKLADIYYAADKYLMKDKSNQAYESKVQYKDKSYRDVIFNKAIVQNKDGVVTGSVGIMTDITKHKKSQAKISRLLKLKDAVLEINYSIMKINNINELLDLILEKAIDAIDNASMGSIFTLSQNQNLNITSYKGYSKDKIKNSDLKLENSFIWHKTKGNIDKTIIINDIEEITKSNLVKVLPNERHLIVKSIISAPIKIDNKLYGFLNVDSTYNNVFDETDLEIMDYLKDQLQIAISKHTLYEKIIYLSRYDKLTNVYNRSYFEELFELYLNKADKLKEHFCLVIFDLDGLKFVNDNYGHLSGDILIKTFSNALSAEIDSNDTLARFGGDEFIAVFPTKDSKTLVGKFQKVTRYLVENKLYFDGECVVCKFSYGISNYPGDSTNYSDLIKIADKRMYKYKGTNKRDPGV